MALPRQRVTLITLGVEDLERAGAFYAAWGWAAHPASQDGVKFYRMNGAADGHVWEIACNPFWPLSDDGGLILPDAG